MEKITEDYTTIVPAYGRDYKNKADAEKDFRDGKDFELMSLVYPGAYCSIRDFAQGTKVQIRYKRQMSVCVVEV